MKKYAVYGGVFIAFYFIFLIANIPVNYVLSKVALPKNVQLYGVEGTIWEFNADVIVTDNITLYEVKGQLSFWSLFTLMPAVDLQFGSPLKPGVEGSLTLRTDGTEASITNGDILFSASEITKNLKLGFPIQAMGDVNLTVNQFKLGKPICSVLSGKAKWKKGKVKIQKDVVALGDFKITLNCTDGAVGLIVDEKNDLGLSYSAYIRGPDKVSSNGFIKPGKKFPAKLKPLLPLIGKADNGVYRIKL